MKYDDSMQQDIKAVRRETTLEKHVQTIMLSVITATILGGFYKINTISESLVRMEERDRGRTEQISLMQGSINRLQNDMSDLKDRVTRFERNEK